MDPVVQPRRTQQAGLLDVAKEIVDPTRRFVQRLKTRMWPIRRLNFLMSIERLGAILPNIIGAAETPRRLARMPRQRRRAHRPRGPIFRNFLMIPAHPKLPRL